MRRVRMKEEEDEEDEAGARSAPALAARPRR